MTNRQTGLIFDKRQTQLLKGIAILFMVLHHVVGVFYNQVDLNWYAQNSENIFSLILIFFSTAGKVCVPLLTILSGFGLTKSYQKFKKSHDNSSSDLRFVFSHLIQFYSIYWSMFIILATVRFSVITDFCEFYGYGFDAIKKFCN